MKTLVEEERGTYEAAWAVTAYADNSPGEVLFSRFMDMTQAEPIKAKYGWWGVERATTVLDAGCGSGKGALALHAAGFAVTMCDITDAGIIDAARSLPFRPVVLWDDVARHAGVHDWVYCCDVLEHIPPVFTMLVIQRLLDASRHGVFLSVSLRGDEFGAFVGKPLHQTVMSFMQWKEYLSAICEVVECRDMLTAAVYLLRKRC